MVSRARTTSGKTWATKFQQLSTHVLAHFWSAILQCNADHKNLHARNQWEVKPIFYHLQKAGKTIPWHVDWQQSVQTGLTLPSYHLCLAGLPHLGPAWPRSVWHGFLLAATNLSEMHQKNLGLIWVSYGGTPLAHTSTIGYNQIEMFKPWKNPNSRWKVEKLWFSLTWRTPWDPGNACRKGHDSKLLCSAGSKKTVKQLKAVWKWMNPNGMSWINLKHRPNTV